MKCFFRSLCELSFVGQASHSFEDHNGQNVLVVESDFESGSVEDEVDDSVNVCFVLNEREDIFAF